MKNVAVLLEDGAFALFFRPHPGEFDSSKVPTPQEFAIQGKKNANALCVCVCVCRGGGGGGRVGSGHSWNWLMLQYTNSKIKNLPCHLASPNRTTNPVSKF